MSPRSYLEKFTALARQPQEVEILRCLENLNVLEWMELVEDLALEPHRLYDIFGAPEDDDLVAAAMTFFEELSIQTQKLLGQALERLLGRRAYFNDANKIAVFQTILDIAAILGKELSEDLLKELTVGENVPQHIRISAASTLAVYGGATAAKLLGQVSVERYPELAPAVIAGLAETDPALALRILGRLKQPLHDLVSLEYPIRIALRELSATRAGRQQIQEMMVALQPWARALLKSILAFEEFKQVEVEILESRRVGRGGKGLSYWRSFKDQAAASREFPFYHPGYSVGKLGEDPDPPGCLLAFVEALRDRVEEETRVSRIELDLVPSWEWHRMISDIELGRAVMGEAGYGTPDRMERLGMVKIGELSLFAVVTMSPLAGWLGVKMIWRRELRSFRRLPISELVPVAADIESIVRKCVERKLQLIVQPGTAIAEIAASTGQGLARGIGRGRIVLGDQIKSVERLAAVVRSDRNCVALLDVLAAAAVVNKAKAKKLNLFLGKYASRLPVGFLYPKGDTEFRAAMVAAVEKSMCQREGVWDTEFGALMRGSLVELDDKPSIVDDSLITTTIARS